MLPALLTEDEAADALKLCPRTLRKQRQAGRLPYVLIGRAIRYTLDDLTQFVESSRQCPSTEEKARHTGGSASRSTVSDFEAARARRARGKLSR
ncbi:helix-turn-helix domain-containing protein [Sphingomonas cannabina]|uniref:helix-turn-helix domain-containing protein n=1 Tax=Sphingomonas cannabina TaxID=2899123 RepID=UPI003872AC6A